MEQYFYSTQIYEDFIILPESEAHHALKVLRKKIGDKITVVDVKSKHQTILGFENIQLNTGLKDNQFHESFLKRIPKDK